MKQAHFWRAVFGGFLGTLVMTILLYLAPLGGAPNMDIAALLGSLLGHGTPLTLSGLWWAGMIWHFVNGTVIFSLLYAYFVYGWLPGENWVRGAIWGIILWIAMELTLMPLTGSGVFSDHAAVPFARDLGVFIVHLVYGVILGAVAGSQAEQERHLAHPA
jgi:uncharacterized membrane protein YagU involved in acid resistance